MINDLKHISEYYNRYEEDKRLHRDKSHEIEFLSTIHYLDKIIKVEDLLLDVGAGTGVYSFNYANKGVKVTALDVVSKNVEIMKSKDKTHQMNIIEGDARDLSVFKENHFDVVLCMGPLYHLEKMEDKLKAISEGIRVLKRDGYLVITYINQQAVYVKRLNDGYLEVLNELETNSNDNSLNPFCFSTPNEMNNLVSQFDVEIIHHIGTDGISPLISDKINQLNEDQFRLWNNFHLKSCEDASLLGYSLHALMICRKKA